MPHSISVVVLPLLLHAAPPCPAVLTSAESVRELTPERAKAGIPARLMGVVTYINPQYGDFFAQDESAGLYVHGSTMGRGIRQGDRVEVQGVTDAGQFAPCVRPTSLRRLGRGPLPDPIAMSLTTTDAGWLHCQFVQAWGFVKSARSSPEYTTLVLESPLGEALIRVPGPSDAGKANAFVGAGVRARGVCVPAFDRQRQLLGGAALYAQSLDQVLVVRSAEAIRRQPIRSSSTLRQFHPGLPAHQRVRVSGVVVGHSRNHGLFVQDETGGFAVPLSPGAPRVEYGARVEATGILVNDRGRLRLTGAVVHDTGSREEPPVRTLTAFAAASPEREHTLARVTGVVLEVYDADPRYSIIFRDGATTCEAWLSSHLPPGVEPGCRVAVTGVITSGLPGQAAAGLHLIARSPADVVVLQRPPPPPEPSPLSPGRALALFGSLGLGTLTALAWVFTLRRQVRQQTDQLRERFDKEATLKEQLRESQKMEALGRLAGGIAHDFNNLLTVINGGGELLQTLIPAGLPDARKLAGDVRQAGERAAGLVAQLLLFSRRQAIALSPLSLGVVLADCHSLLGRLIGEHIRVAVRIGPDVPLVNAAPTLLHQILINLAVNARDAMPGGGELAIELARQGGMARLTVTDTGCGMDAATRARAFEPFFTTKGPGKGTGLGLATVYGIVQTLGGEIRVRSEPGRGTTFEIDLPAAPAPPPPEVELPEVIPSTGAPRTVLVVEDDEKVRDLARRGLEAAGYRVLPATGPREALELIRAGTSRIDLLLTDVVMPGMNGRQLSELAQALLPHLRVLFMSGYTDDEILRHGVKTEQARLLLKPFHLAELSRMVGEALGGA
ncbi:MAG: ATP-binding protein [Gemmataceae bacterium]